MPIHQREDPDEPGIVYLEFAPAWTWTEYLGIIHGLIARMRETNAQIDVVLIRPYEFAGVSTDFPLMTLLEKQPTANQFGVHFVFVDAKPFIKFFIQVFMRAIPSAKPYLLFAESIEQAKGMVLRERALIDDPQQIDA